MKLHNRYESIAGVRLDTAEQGGSAGPALDLSLLGSALAQLFVRESGQGEDAVQASIELDMEAVVALRDGCNRLLVDQGVEVFVNVPVPK